MRVGVLATLAMLLANFPAHSQRITASLAGVVGDPSESVVPGALVRVINRGTAEVTLAKTDDHGHFLFPSLAPAVYDISVEGMGFKRLEQKGLTLNVLQDAQVEFRLEVGSTSEIMEVTARGPLLDSNSGQLGQVIENQSIANLPLNQRNPFSLILLAPGVTGTVGTTFTGLQFNVNGGRSGTTDVLLDGIPSTPPTDAYNALTIFPSVDAVQEFKVQTSSYSAEFGLSGGGIINLIYKSGTNAVHGSAYDFLRNSVMDANNFFANRTGTPLASFKRNQFGGSLGGPVLLPRIYDGRNRTFFFFSYEGLRQRTASYLSTTVPTRAERAGDFSGIRTSTGAPITIYDPLTTTPTSPFMRTAFPGNQIPPSRFDKVAANVLRYWPLPNVAGQGGGQVNNFFASSAAPYSIDQYDIKGDQVITDRQRLSLRWSQRRPTQSPAQFWPADIFVAQNAVTNRQNGFGGALDYTSVRSPSHLMKFRWGISHVYYRIDVNSPDFDPTQLGFPSYIRDSANALGFPAFEVTGYAGIGIGSNLSRGSLGMLEQTWSLANTKTFSRHTLRFGAEVRAMANNSNQLGRATGAYTFPVSFTQGPNGQSASATAGDGFASFLLGLGGGTLTHNFKIIDTVSQYIAGYFQDDYKATSRLTLNLGLRYDLFVPRVERHNRAVVVDPTAPSPLAGPSGIANLTGGLQYVGVNGYPRTQNDTDWKDFGPRFGFAYRASKQTVVRGGYGIFFGPSPSQAAATVTATGFRTDSTFFGSIDGTGLFPYNYLSDPFPNASFIPVRGSSQGLLTTVGQSIAAPGRYNKTPYVQNFNLGIQYQFSGDWLLETSYSGSRGVDLIWSPSINQLPLENLALGSRLLTQVKNPFYGLITGTSVLAQPTVQQRYLLAPYPQFTGVQIANAPGASSNYNSLQVRVEKRFARGLSVLGAFTWGKMMDDASSNNTGNLNGNGTSEDAYNRHLDYSLSTADVARRLVVSYVYELPFGRGQHFGGSWNRLTDAILGGWQTNGIIAWQTGLPLVFTANNQANIFNPGSRPNNNGISGELSGPVEDRLNRYFNTSVFSQPALYTIGNMSRTSDIRAPGLRNFDLSLFKNFQLTEKLKLQYRAEAFNAFNTPQFGAPNSSVTSASFGVVTTQANSPRQLQMALKLLF